MQAVLLAGGVGTRLRPLTYTVPKPLVPVLNRPLLAHVLERLPKEVDEVLLTVSYRTDDLREWAKRSTDPALDGRELVIIDEAEPLGTGGAVRNCADAIDGTFLVLNADLVSDLDTAAHIAKHRERNAVGSLAMYQLEEVSRFGVMDWQPETGRIRHFVEKPAPGFEPSHYVNAGCYVLEPEVLDHIEPDEQVSIEREVFPLLCRLGLPMYGFPFEGLWIDCGTPPSYLEIHRELLERSGIENLFGPRTQVDPERMRLRRSVLGADVRLGDGVRIEDSVLHDGVEVGAGARLTRTIVGPGARIAAHCVLRDVVVGPEEHVQSPDPLDDVRIGMRD